MRKIRLNRATRALATGLLAGLLPGIAAADVVLSSNDGHTVADSKGALVAPSKPTPDTLSIIDVSQYPPKIKDTIEVPGSVVSPMVVSDVQEPRMGRKLTQCPTRI